MDMTFLPGKLTGQIVAPPSKSEAHRRMICAGLSRGETEITRFMASEDTRATAKCLEALGAQVSQTDDVLRVQGFTQKPEMFPVFDCGESGSTLRFFVPLALTLCHGGIFRMHGHLAKRPMEVYKELFVPRGVNWHMNEGADGAAELMVSGNIRSGEYILPGNVSSQFVSGLLFALPLMEGDSTLTVQTPVESAGYIRMTIAAIKESGVRIEEIGPYAWRIPGRQVYRAKDGNLQGDWSQAAVLLCADALGSEVTIGGLSTQSLQGDAAIVECLERMGCSLYKSDAGIRMAGGDLAGLEADMQDHPDIVPMLALVCQLADGDSRLMNCGRLRIKECDRLSGTRDMLNALGGDASIEGDSLVIHGVKKLSLSGHVNTFRDHRMVMLASIAALMTEQGVHVSDAEALDKSWPGYLETYRALGGRTA